MIRSLNIDGNFIPVSFPEKVTTLSKIREKIAKQL